MDTADLNVVVCWVVFFFSPFLSFCSGGQKLLSDCSSRESFKFSWAGGLQGVGVAASIVKGTVLFECEGTHTCVFLCQLLFDVASCFSGTKA